MINILSGATNSVVLRLSATASVYLFEVQSVQSGEVFLFTADNISPSSKFFECRIVEIGDDETVISPTASEPHIKLSYSGTYNYTLWGTDNYSLQPEGQVLDRGKLVFKKSFTYQNPTFDLDDNIEIVIFDPESLTFFILTEASEILQTEGNEKFIYADTI